MCKNACYTCSYSVTLTLVKPVHIQVYVLTSIAYSLKQIFLLQPKKLKYYGLNLVDQTFPLTVPLLRWRHQLHNSGRKGGVIFCLKNSPVVQSDHFVQHIEFFLRIILICPFHLQLEEGISFSYGVTGEIFHVVLQLCLYTF